MAQQTTAGRIRRRVLPSKDRFWRPSDFEGTETAVLRALSRLAADGELLHVRRGLYWRGAPTPAGPAKPTAMQVVVELIGKEGVGPAQQDAVHALGLTASSAEIEVIACPSRPPREVANARLINRAGRRGRLGQKLNSLEVTVLEALEAWRWVDRDPIRAEERMCAVLVDDKVRLRRLALAATDEPARVRERLRSLLLALEQNDLAEMVPRARSAALRLS